MGRSGEGGVRRGSREWGGRSGEGGVGREEWGVGVGRSGEWGGSGEVEWGGRSPLAMDMKHCHVGLAYPCSPLKYTALFLTTSTTPS